MQVDCWSSPHWLLTLSTLTVDPLHIECWPSLHWVLTLSTLSVDPLYTVHWLLILSTLLTLSTLTVNPPRINRGDCLFTQKWKLTVDSLCVNCWSAPPPPGSTVLIASVVLIVDPLRVDCRSTPLQISTFQSLIYWLSPLLLLTGFLLHHDDSTTDRSEGSQRNKDEAETKRLWFQTYKTALAIPGKNNLKLSVFRMVHLLIYLLFLLENQV